MADTFADPMHPLHKTKKKSRFVLFLHRHLTTIIIAVIFIIGVGLLVYPSFSDYWNSFHQSRAIMNYAKSVSQIDEKEYEKVLQAAEDYNTQLGKTGINWTLTEEEKEEYNSLLNIEGTGIMGYIKIPKINIELPIYHGTDDAVLQTSIGHLEGSSLPVGGKSSHCALSGHRGLPSAKLFSDLDQLKEGDTFTLTILNETLTYEVDQIRVVEPTDLSDLSIVEGQDLCTLITCTPYGINTHRLLVRGHRIANADGNARVIADALQIRPIYIAPFIAFPVVIILLLIMFVHTGKKKMSSEQVEIKYLEREGLRRPDPEIFTTIEIQKFTKSIRNYFQNKRKRK